MAFSVAFLCTGNICRSPVAERIFRARLRNDAPVTVWSAGTAGLAGYGIDPPSADALRELGIDPAGHVGQRLDLERLRGADLVLTASAEHRATVLHGLPTLMSRAFTLREFARLAAGLVPRPTADPAQSGPDAASLRRTVRAVAGLRGRVAVVDPSVDEIPDPYGRDAEVARQCVASISAAIDDVLTALGLR